MGNCSAPSLLHSLGLIAVFSDPLFLGYLRVCHAKRKGLDNLGPEARIEMVEVRGHHLARAFRTSGDELFRKRDRLIGAEGVTLLQRRKYLAQVGLRAFDVSHLPCLGGELGKVLRGQGLLREKAHPEAVEAAGELPEPQEEFDVGGRVCNGRCVAASDPESWREGRLEEHVGVCVEEIGINVIEDEEELLRCSVVELLIEED